jgi:hypothetical protein
MPIDATRSGVASQLAPYFSNNYQALLQSSAAQLPITPLAPDAWKQTVNATGSTNANTRFFLKQDGTLTKQATSATSEEGWAPPDNSVEIDLNVAHGIEAAGLSPTDWLMQRMADEFRLNATVNLGGSVLTQLPEPEMDVDFNSLDTASLVRLLNMLTGRARDNQRESAIGNAQDRGRTMIGLSMNLGLTSQALTNALELQAAYQSNATVNSGVESLLSGQDNAARDTLVSTALQGLLNAKSNELEGARLAFRATATANAEPNVVRNMTRMVTAGLETTLQSAADIALMDFSYASRYGSELDYQQTNDGLLVQTQGGATRQQQADFVAEQLRAALTEPGFRQGLIDAMSQNAQALGTAAMALPDQQALYGEIADAVIGAALQSDSYLQALAAQSVQFRADIAQLISNEVDASRERDSTPRNV